MTARRGALFVSDLHLCETRPRPARAFLELLAGEARRADSLYILGDLFEVWVGDDDLATPLHADIAAALRALGTQGTAVRIMHGNRDFLLGEGFEQASGALLIPDPSVIVRDGVATLLTHGDALCLADRGYQQARDELRAPAWRHDFLARPLAERRALAQAMRAQSEAAKRAKSAAEMDVDLPAALALMRRHACRRMIHGHTHRPARHVHRDTDGTRVERWVLPDWYEQGEAVWLWDASSTRPVRAAHPTEWLRPNDS